MTLFLDRDDTLVHDDGYMSRPEQIRLLPGVGEALRRAADAGCGLYLVTNQSGIGRGLYTLAEAEACNDRLIELLNVEFSGICIAPEMPDVPSKYRKPSPTFILEMIARDALDPAACFMIGDKISDLECGINAGITPILVGSRPDAIEFAKKHNIHHFSSVVEFVDEFVFHSM